MVLIIVQLDKLCYDIHFRALKEIEFHSLVRGVVDFEVKLVVRLHFNDAEV